MDCIYVHMYYEALTELPYLTALYDIHWDILLHTQHCPPLVRAL
jgi:hypothetical protein